MPFDWKAFVDHARWLQSQANTSVNPEAVRRTALSRAYYGAFCYARNYARDFLGFPLGNDAGDHGKLRAYLKSKRRLGPAESLDRLRQWRNDGDYLDELSFDLQVVVTTALGEAKKVFDSLPPPKQSL